MDKSPDAFRTISEVAEALETPAHVLRFWESRFPQIRPVKRAGGRRYYRPADVALLTGIKRLLHDEGMTIRGVQKVLREQGIRHVSGLQDDGSPEEEALDAAMSGRFDDEPGMPLDVVEDETAAALTAALDADPPRVIPFAPPQPQPVDPAPDDTALSQVTAPQAGTEHAPVEAQTPSLQGTLDWLNSLPPASAGAELPHSDATAGPVAASDLAEAGSAADVSAAPQPAQQTAQPLAQPPGADRAPDPRAQPEDATATIAARLRALPLGSLGQRQEALAALAAQIADLRGRLAGLPPRR